MPSPVNPSPSTDFFLSRDYEQALASHPACRSSAYLYLNLHARLKVFRNVDSIPFPTREAQRVRSFTGEILKGDHPHPDQVTAVNALIALCQDSFDSLRSQERSLDIAPTFSLRDTQKLYKFFRNTHS